ncbi:MAG TPA: hypothetical protein VHA56_06820 [Mucilaginibacter sp.]|nr:hypothetical protein [Mucilaginibacter sp.]
MKASNGPVLTGKEGGALDLNVAKEWMKNHQDKHPDEPHSHYFGREILEKILSQPGCVGLRFHHGFDPSATGFKRQLIITGVTAEGADMMNVKPGALSRAEMTEVTTVSVTEVQTYDLIGDQSFPCPGSPGCPK